MHHSSDRIPSRDAVARRRRMSRRHVTRPLLRVFTAAVVVATLAVSATATRRVPPVPGTPAPVEPGTPSTRRGPLASPVAMLPLPPLWRPAGDVLSRTTRATGRTLPFGLDPREGVRGESLSRWHRVYLYSAKYRIKLELARKIFDAAVAADIEPELGFRLIRVESVFNPRAVSPAGALGLTQLMLGTAREFEPAVTRQQLLDPEVNLRIGFRYLRALIREQKGDLKLALLVYNRGPVAVQRSISLGLDPANGYESLITKGYRGRGVLE